MSGMARPSGPDLHCSYYYRQPGCVLLDFGEIYGCLSNFSRYLLFLPKSETFENISWFLFRYQTPKTEPGTQPGLPLHPIDFRIGRHLNAGIADCIPEIIVLYKPELPHSLFPRRYNGSHSGIRNSRVDIGLDYAFRQRVQLGDQHFLEGGVGFPRLDVIGVADEIIGNGNVQGVGKHDHFIDVACASGIEARNSSCSQIRRKSR